VHQLSKGGAKIFSGEAARISFGSTDTHQDPSPVFWG